MKKKTKKRRLLAIEVQSFDRGAIIDKAVVIDLEANCGLAGILFTATAKKLLAMRDDLKRLRREVKELQPSLGVRGERTERFADVDDD